MVTKLKAIITGKNTEDSHLCDYNQEQLVSNSAKMVSENSNDLSCGSLSKLVQNFNNMNTNELDSITPLSNQIKNDFSIIVYEICNIFDQGISEEILKQETINYFNNHNIPLQQIYNWLLNNQNNTKSVFLLGIFSHLGMLTDLNNQKAFELFQKAANLGNAYGINYLGYCYLNGIGTDVNKQKAFELYQKAADLGFADAINQLGYCYQFGIGTDINEQKALEMFTNTKLKKQ